MSPAVKRELPPASSSGARSRTSTLSANSRAESAAHSAALPPPTTTTSYAISIRLDVRLDDDFLPPRLLFGDELGVLLRGRAHGFCVIGLEALDHRGTLRRFRRLVGEPPEDGRRRFRRRVEAIPLARLEAGIALLSDSAHVRQRRQALRRADRDDA